jgi:hypothetical protein
MARLIDVTDLINKCKSLSNEHETTSISYNALYEVLLQQPTVYDVEKVIAVFDKPNNCEECPCSRIGNIYDVCQLARRSKSFKETEIPEWCPLCEDKNVN